jgi:hypothetical protein
MKLRNSTAAALSLTLLFIFVVVATAVAFADPIGPNDPCACCQVMCQCGQHISYEGHWDYRADGKLICVSVPNPPCGDGCLHMTYRCPGPR